MFYSHLHLGLSRGSSPQVSPPNPAMHLYFPSTRATSLAHLILHNLITRLVFGEKYRSKKLSLCSSLNSYVKTSLLAPSIFLNIPFSDIFIPRVCPSLYVTDRVSRSYKTTGKSTVLYNLILTFADSIYEDRRF